jgi:hypothetical protein
MRSMRLRDLFQISLCGMPPTIQVMSETMVPLPGRFVVISPLQFRKNCARPGHNTIESQLFLGKTRRLGANNPNQGETPMTASC